jgi:hypothetical protein
MPRPRLLVVVLLLSAGAATAVGAQVRSKAWFESTFGGTALVGDEPFRGEYYKRNSDVLMLLTFGLQPDVRRFLVTSLELGFLGIPLGDDSCRITPLGDCTGTTYPFNGVIAIMAGGRAITSPWRFVEVTAGPALIGQSGEGNPIGALGKVRIGSPPGTYLSPGIAMYGITKVSNGGLIFGIGAGVSLRTW